ncbi:MAG: ABC transporter permease, partial [Acidimicrobiales bacterium]
MLRATIASLVGHRRRLVGTVFAIVAGVAFLAGTLVLGDTLRANFDRLLSDATAGTDAIVRAPTPFTAEASAGRPLVDESLAETLRGVDGVAAVEGRVQGYGRIIGRDGDGIGGSGPPTFAASWITDPDLNPYQIAEGRAPEADDEVVINRGAAEDGNLAVGDRTIVQVPAPIEVTIVGIATFGDADGLGPTTFAAFTLPAAQEHLLGGPGRVTEFVVDAEPGVSQAELAANLSPVMPDSLEVVTGGEATSEQLDDIRSDFLDMFSTILVVFGAIGLGVATFTIHNTFSILVAQRTREAALFRALGASRRQVLGSVTTEAAVIGLVASIIGAALGVGVAAGLLELFHAFGFPLPGGGMTVSAASVVVAIVVGVAATALAALSPAVRAARVSP